MTKEELEKEAEEYRKELKSKFFLSEPQLDLSCEGYKDGLKKQEKRIAELTEHNETLMLQIQSLGKENAELKEYNKYLRRKRQGGIQKQYNKVAIIKQQDEQLTKAKYILKYVLNSFVGDLPRNLGYFDEEELKAMAKAEQFLNDEGCPDVMCEDCTKECGMKKLGLEVDK